MFILPPPRSLLPHIFELKAVKVDMEHIFFDLAIAYKVLLYATKFICTPSVVSYFHSPANCHHEKWRSRFKIKTTFFKNASKFATMKKKLLSCQASVQLFVPLCFQNILFSFSSTNREPVIMLVYKVCFVMLTCFGVLYSVSVFAFKH